MFKMLMAGCLTCASLSILSAGSVRVQELVSARVLSIEGQVEIHRATPDQPRSHQIAFKVEDELKAGDTIVTGKGGRLVLGLSDGSQAIIAPLTTVIIKDLRQSPRTLFQIIRGKARIHIEKLGGQPNPYRVNTPTAVIAVRGTTFDLLVEEEETKIYLHEGEVTVTNLRTPDQPVLLVAGQMTQVLMQRLPKPPASFKVGQNDRTFKIERRGSGLKVRRGEEIWPGHRRVAGGLPRPAGPGGPGGPGAGRSSSISDGRARPDPGRGGPAANPRPAGKNQ